MYEYMSKWQNEKENLIELLINQNLSFEEVGRRYNCSGSNIRKIVYRLDIDIPKRRKVNPCETFNRGKIKKTTANCIVCGSEFKVYKQKKNKYCSIKCEGKHKHNLGYEKILNGDPSIMRANYSPKNYKCEIIKEQNGVCAICGCNQEHNGKPLVFILDHIDGNAANNKRDNLRCVCPNCDSQLDTYKSKNKNGARSYYRYHKYDENTKIGK